MIPRRTSVNLPLMFLNCAFKANSSQQALYCWRRKTTNIPQVITPKLGKCSLKIEMMPGGCHRNLITTLTTSFPNGSSIGLVLILIPCVCLWQPLDLPNLFLRTSFLYIWITTLKCQTSLSLERKPTYTVEYFDIFITAFSEASFAFLFWMPLDHNMLSWKWRSLRDHNPGKWSGYKDFFCSPSYWRKSFEPGA